MILRLQSRNLASISFLSPSSITKPIPEICRKTVGTQLLLSRLVLEDSKDFRDDRVVLATTQLLKTSEAYNQVFTTTEMGMIKRDLGEWTAMEKFKYDMYWERLGVLCFILGIAKVPEGSVNFKREEVYKSTGIIPGFEKSIETFLEYYQTQEFNGDLKMEINIAEAWFWRAKAQVILVYLIQIIMDLRNSNPDLKKLPRGLKTVMDNIQEAVGG